MSEEKRITKVEKEKDPRRVEAGKRLASISRSAKEKKARQRSEAEQQHTEQTAGKPEPTEDTCEEGYSMITVLTGVGVLTGLGCLYFTYKQDKRAQTTAECEQQPTEVSIQQPTPSSGSKLRSLDD